MSYFLKLEIWKPYLRPHLKGTLYKVKGKKLIPWKLISFITLNAPLPRLLTSRMVDDYNTDTESGALEVILSG